MKIENYGFAGWFKEGIEGKIREEMEIVRVVSVNKNSFVVTNGEGEIYAEVTGKFLFNSESSLDFPVVGDWVYVQIFDANSLAIIHEVLPRRTLLKRKAAGKQVEYQLIAANIDYAIVMQALDNNFNLRRLERYLVMIYESEIIPKVFLSKKDLLGEEEVNERIAEVRSIFPEIDIVAFSNNEVTDIEVVKSCFEAGKTYCLLGSSGVGKTTLLNNLISGEKFKTDAIREKDGRGKHTTTRRELIMTDGGALLIDTPGMRELGVITAGEGLVETFDEIAGLGEECRYKDCTHTVELDCAIIAAVEAGEISRERYENYLKLQKEAAYNEMSYYEKRQKDKKFGKFMHHYFKDKKDGK